MRCPEDVILKGCMGVILGIPQALSSSSTGIYHICDKQHARGGQVRNLMTSDMKGLNHMTCHMLGEQRSPWGREPTYICLLLSSLVTLCLAHHPCSAHACLTAYCTKATFLF